VHWAHLVRHRFPDGQLFVNLRGNATTPPLRAVDAFARFLCALGVPARRVPSDVDDAAAMYRSLLADRRMLVLLDDAHRADQVRPLLPAGAGCLVLVTSRDRLADLVARDGARPVDVDVLTAAEAQALLTRVLGADRVAAEPGAAADLARLCGYLPLALRTAAADLAVGPRHSIADHLADLCAGDRHTTLRAESDAERAVRAASGLSCAALPAPTQRLFRLLGLVPGPDVTAGAAAALATIPPDEALSMLRQLVTARLLDWYLHRLTTTRPATGHRAARCRAAAPSRDRPVRP
jgi:hypothetical protein